MTVIVTLLFYHFLCRMWVYLWLYYVGSDSDEAGSVVQPSSSRSAPRLGKPDASENDNQTIEPFVAREYLFSEC